MGEKAYNDGKKLAEARWRGGEKRSYEQMAEDFDCSAGTISLRFNHPEHYGVAEGLEKYGPEDFEHLDNEPEKMVEDDGPDYPLDLKLPKEWPPTQEEIDEYIASGVSTERLLDEVRWGCDACTARFRSLVKGVFNADPEMILNTETDNE